MRVSISILIVITLCFSALAADRRTPVVLAVEKAGPAVVNIRTEQIMKGRSSVFGFGDPFFEEFFRDLAPPRLFTTESLGSGVIVDPRGYVLTNAHVIAKASKIFVALPGKKVELEAKLVGQDERLDLAVLRIQGGGTFAHLPLSSSADLMLGETVIAIGNPLGLSHSITTGVVSSPNRRFSLEQGVVSTFIQTDALINPGNSGGAADQYQWGTDRHQYRHHQAGAGNRFFHPERHCPPGPEGFDRKGGGSPALSRDRSGAGGACPHPATRAGRSPRHPHRAWVAGGDRRFPCGRRHPRGG